MSVESVIKKLQSRRKTVFIILLAISFIAVGVEIFFDIKPLHYFEYEIQLLLVYTLISYKLIELVIIYFIFYHRHMIKCRNHNCSEALLSRFEKNGKRFFILVAQGNIVFGIIAYKLSGMIGYLFLFLFFALLTLSLVRPHEVLKKQDK